MNKYLILCILFLFGIGIFFRLYNLNWGAPFYFHPDERNIVSSVSQLKFPDQLNPHFFAYGTIPIYFVFATGLIFNFLTSCKFSLDGCNVNFEQAIIIGRIYSVLLSILMLPIIFMIGKKIKNKTVGILSAFLAIFSVGLIQFSHFSTFEIWLTFFSLILFYLSLLLMEKIRLQTIIFAGIIMGVLVAIKVSSIILLPIPAIALTFSKQSKKIKHISVSFLSFLVISIISLITFIITNPFSLLNFKSFESTFNYESSVALGTLPVFYTGEFYGTIPIVFHFQKIYPFILNPILTILFIPSFIYVSFLCLKTKNKYYFLLITCYLILFVSQAFLFVKWTRYIIPTLPFIYLIIAVSIDHFFQNKKRSYYYIFALLIIAISILFSFSYVKTVFINRDPRLEATVWSLKKIPSKSKILSEVYDLGITTFNPYYSNIELFNFYELDNNSKEFDLDSLNQKMKTTNYIIIPSQRLYQTRIQHKKEFPNGNKFYTQLFNNSLGFTKIYETPCDLFCKILYVGNTSLIFEQTASVFDHPIVSIFKRNE